MDMHSGGGQKEKWAYIFIEAPEEEAQVIFQNRFGHNPNRVTCTCCGEDYSIDESPTLEEITAYYRGCDYDEEARKYVEKQATKYACGRKYATLEEYLKDKDILVIYEKDILPEERKGELREQGYVWMD
jgi:transcription elongation factor Elf1